MLSIVIVMDLNTSEILFLITGVLAGLVLLLGGIYAYIYYCKMRPRKRINFDRRITRRERNGGTSNVSNDKKDTISVFPILGKFKNKQPK